MADRMDVLDGSIGQHDPVIMLVIHVSCATFHQQFSVARSRSSGWIRCQNVSAVGMPSCGFKPKIRNISSDQ